MTHIKTRAHGSHHMNRPSMTDSDRNACCTPAPDAFRRSDGSIDFDFYRGIAKAERRLAVKHSVSVFRVLRLRLLRTMSNHLPWRLHAHSGRPPLVSGSR